MEQPFSPKYGSTAQITSSASSASVNLDPGMSSRQVRVVNTGANIAYFRIGPGEQTATEADFPVPPNMASTVSKDPQHETLAHISPLGTTLKASLGEGM